jgi:predicted RNA-binding Zn ribbon-like protein
VTSTTIPLVGEPLAIDLVNTRVQPPGAPELDFLANPDTFHAWLAAEGDRVATPSGDVNLGALRELRGHIDRALHDARHGMEPSARARVALSAAQRAAPTYRELGWDGAGVTAAWRRAADPTENLLAELADAAADLLTDPSVRTVRRCEGPECRMLFLPTHPRRRWCSPALCGNRVRVARYYERHKQESRVAGEDHERG